MNLVLEGSKSYRSFKQNTMLEINTYFTENLAKQVNEENQYY